MFFKRDSPIETGMKRKKDNKKVKLSLNLDASQEGQHYYIAPQL